MSERDPEVYFARFRVRPFLRFTAYMLPLLLLFVAAWYYGVSTAPANAQTAFARAFLTTFAGGGIAAWLVLVSFIPILAYRRVKSRPFVVIDDRALTMGMLKLQWPVIKETFLGTLDGAPFIGVRTLNDDAVLRKLPRLFAWSFARRRKRLGAAFIVLPVVEIPMEELRRRIEERAKSSAAARAQ